MEPVSYPERVKKANEWLAGSDSTGLRGVTLSGLPKFRLVWSENVFENQPSYAPGFNLWGGDIKWTRVPKYRGIGIENQWVLERLLPDGYKSAWHEFNEGEDSRYDIIWSFPKEAVDAHGPPGIPHCDLILRSMESPPELTEDDVRIIGAPLTKKQEQEIMDIMEDGRTPTVEALKSGEGVFMDSTKQEGTNGA